MEKMEPFNFQAPTRIRFGIDTAGSVADIVKDLGGKKTLIVTDANLIKAGILEAILDSFGDHGGPQPVIFDKVPPDSDIECVTQATALARQSGCDSIVGVGGGSVMDTAKAVNIGLTYGGDIMEYQGINTLPSHLLPLVAVPTTAGTGSEVSFVAMVKDPEEAKKILFGSQFLAPDAAILDPALIKSLPPKLTAATGFDALTHDIESFVASTHSPLSDALALESMSLLFEHLARATVAGDDLAARSATLVASTMAGLAFTNAGVGIVHALAHATGGLFGTHHGMTNAVFLPHGMEYNLDVAGSRYASAARFLGISSSADDRTAARAMIDAVKRLMSSCGLSTCLRDLGVPELSNGEVENLAFIASTDPAIMFNPKEPSVEEIVAIYKRAY
jgi:alcohol dehydrogenase class IV